MSSSDASSPKKPPLCHEKACIEPAIARAARVKTLHPTQLLIVPISRSTSCCSIPACLSVRPRPCRGPASFHCHLQRMADRRQAGKSHHGLHSCNRWPASRLAFATFRVSSCGLNASFGNRKFSSKRTKFVFLSVPRNTGCKFAGTNKHAIFGPRIAAEACGKKDGVNSSACQAVTCRRSARPE
jgi:hypothetical protein